MSLFPQSLLVLALLSGSPFAFAQSNSGVADPLLEGASGLAMAADGDALIFASRPYQWGVPFFQLMHRLPGSLNYGPGEAFATSQMVPGTIVYGIAMEGNVIAHQTREPFGGDEQLFIHERGAAGWSTQSVPLYSQSVVSVGALTAISNGRIAALHTKNLLSWLWLNIVEQDPAGQWSVVDSVRTSIRSPWLSYQSDVVLDGDVAAVGGIENAVGGEGVISVCEPDAAGDWAQTTLLLPPSSGNWSVEAIAIDGPRLAAIRSRLVGPDREYVLHTYQRNGIGDWSIDRRRPIPTPAGSPSATGGHAQPVWTLLFDGSELVVSSTDGATFYSAAQGAPITPVRRVTGLGVTIQVDGGRAIGVDRGLARIVDLNAQPGDLHVDQLAGQSTCPSTGTASLRLHRSQEGFGSRRVVAQVEGAPAGSTALLYRATMLAPLPAASTGLCLDRRSLMRVGTPKSIGPSGRADFPLAFTGANQSIGIENAQHVQAVILGGSQAGAFSLTNGMAWIP